MKLYTKIFLIIFPFLIAFSLSVTFYGFNNQRKTIQQDIDERLETIVHLIKDTLPSDYHDLIINEDSMTHEEYNLLVDRYNKTCDKLGLKYLWSLLVVDGHLVFTSSTSPDHNVSMGKHANFFEVHSNPEVYEAVLRTGKIQYQTNNTEKWGGIRAVLIPFEDIHGRTYIFGASVELTYWTQLLRSTLRQFLTLGLILTLIGAILSFFLARLTAIPLNRLVKRTSQISNGELNNKITHLEEMGSYEERILIRSFNKMSDFISLHISDLNRIQENLRMTLNSIGDGVIVVDLDGCVSSMNPAASKLIGWTSEEAMGKSISYVFNIHNSQTNQIVKNPVYSSLESGEIVNLELNTILTARGGEQIHISDSAAPIRNTEGDIMGVILVFSDISEEHKLQDQLRQSQKMDAIGQLAGGIAHDFNNMIGGIYGAIDLLQPLLINDNESLSYLDMIENSASQAAELTKKLLVFSRKQSVPSTAIDLHKLLENTIGILQSTLDRRIELILSLEAGSYYVAGDASQLQSIFLNLGINASHAMPEGGTLHYRTGNIKLNQDYCDSSHFDISPGHYLSLEIIDTGCGMTPEIQTKVFEPFFTTKNQDEGTGLGLSVAYGSIVQHNGTITVKSQLNRGTLFQILLPVTQSTKAVNRESEKLIRGTGHILLIDDESVMRRTGKALLEDLGYTVTTVDNGYDAIDLVSQKKEIFDLVIMDMNMPKLHGYDCFYKLKEVKDDLKILISSGLPQKENVDRMKKDGLLGYIQKPFRIAQLSHIIARILGRNRV